VLQRIAGRIRKYAEFNAAVQPDFQAGLRFFVAGMREVAEAD